MTDSFEEQLWSAFPAGAITRVQVVQYGDDPEVEPEKTVVMVLMVLAAVVVLTSLIH